MPDGAAGAPDGGRVVVVVVNYNGGRRLEEVLASHRPAGEDGPELVVVDNASTDGSRETIRAFAARRGGVRAVLNERNLGYSAAVNEVARSGESEYLAVLNMDVVVEPGWLGPLVDHLDAHPELAAVNPLITTDAGDRVAAAGQAIHVSGLGFNRSLGLPVEAMPRRPFRVSGIQGGAFVVRRRALLEVGGMDAAGFLYHEDVHLSWLLRLAGHDLACVPASRVRHDYFLSMYPEKFYLLERNRLALLLAYLRPPTLLLLSPVLLLTEAMAWAYSLLRGAAFLRAKAASYRWVAASRRRLRRRHTEARRWRRIGDLRLLGRLHWRYRWDQFAVLGRERGVSRRRPVGGLPTHL